MSMWRPFAPDAVRVIQNAISIARDSNAPKLSSDHLYRALVEELGAERVALSTLTIARMARPTSSTPLRPSTADGSPRFARDARSTLERAIKVAAQRDGLVRGEDLLSALSYTVQHRRLRLSWNWFG